MSRRAACARADLVRALASGDARVVRATAEALGYDPPAEPSPKPQPSAGDKTTLSAEGETRPAAPLAVEARPLVDIPFWRVESYEPGSEILRQEVPMEPVEIVWKNRPTAPPRLHLIAPWRDIHPRLRRSAAHIQETRVLDVSAVARQLGEGRQLFRLPYERRRRWGPYLQIIADRSERLVPYWLDQQVVGHALAATLPDHLVEVGAVWEGLAEPRLFAPGAEGRPYALPPPGTLVLVLGDLGALAAGDTELQRGWRDFGLRLRDAGCRPVALMPLPAGRCPGELRSAWKLIEWGRFPGGGAADPPLQRRRAERLLRLVSPALRIEPGFLRAVRLLLPAAEADIATESDAWQDAAIASTSAEAATLDPEAARRLRAAFADEPPELQRRVLALLQVWRGPLAQEIWFEEILCLAPRSRQFLPNPEDLAQAEHFFRQISQQARGLAPGGLGPGVLSWYRRCERRLTESAWRGETGEALHRLSWALHGDDPAYRPAAGFDPALAPAGRERNLAVRQVGGMLQFAEDRGDPALERGGSPLARLASTNGLVTVGLAEVEPEPDNFWPGGQPPSWAEDWGWDEFGAWVTFTVTPAKGGAKVTQRMRWIRPGRFLMGSPEDEPERRETEGPQHPVTLASGFWLFDTACTQALWQAGMDYNPSDFKGTDRPVEWVSWDETQRFITSLSAMVPGLDLALPSEAQWEYACRAGTETPFSFGENINPEQVNYNGEYPNWGGKKSTYRAETVPVGSLPPNAWGLYEMHGNVGEWVQDEWHENYRGAPQDGRAWVLQSKEPADRVIRGGSWIQDARDCRCATRRRYWPGVRSASGRDAPGSSRAAARRDGGAEAGAAGDASLQPETVSLEALSQASLPLPRASAFRIVTDRDRLTLRPVTKPRWASAMGRDGFGL